MSVEIKPNVLQIGRVQHWTLFINTLFRNADKIVRLEETAEMDFKK